MATDAAFNPLNLMLGETLSPSQVCMGGNSRKSRETMRLSITTKIENEKIYVSFPVLLSPVSYIPK